jgi:hypothetical protein
VFGREASQGREADAGGDRLSDVYRLPIGITHRNVYLRNPRYRTNPVEFMPWNSLRAFARLPPEGEAISRRIRVLTLQICGICIGAAVSQWSSAPAPDFGQRDKSKADGPKRAWEEGRRGNQRSTAFKAWVAITALSGDKTWLLSAEIWGHTTMIRGRKWQPVTRAGERFGRATRRRRLRMRRRQLSGALK